MRTLPLMLLLAGAALPLAAQSGPVRDVPVVAPVADSLTPVFDQLDHLAPVADTAFTIRGITLDRGGVQIRLDSGTVRPLTPVNGRTVGLLFDGAGRVLAIPSTAYERAHLRLMTGDDSIVSASFSSAVFVFTDSTWIELSAHATPGGGGTADRSLVSDVVDILGGLDHKGYTSVLGPILDGERNGGFFAYFKADQGHPLAIGYDPDEQESVALMRRTPGTMVGKFLDELAAYDPDGTPTSGKETTRTAAVTNYAMDLHLPESGGSLAYSAGTELTIVPDGPEGPWVWFDLDPRLIADSASFGGKAIPVWKLKDHSSMWLRLDRRLAAGDTARVKVWYHGDFIDRFGDWFLVDPGTAWYPIPSDLRNLATFDITLHTPDQYPILTVGVRSDSTPEPGHMLRTRWVTSTPMRNAAFNLGVFKESVLTASGIPPITYIYSDRAINYGLGANRIVVTPDRKERERVGSDIQQALKFFTAEFGGPPVDRFYVAPIPYSEGVAFPGMIDLSQGTFNSSNGAKKGFDQFFRAHEVSHQWWGIAVDFASFHDQWLSEGMASFSGLWFMQTGLHDNKLYFDFLDQYRDDIKGVQPAGPVAEGYRAGTQDHPSAGTIMLYEKGAWLAHMLRILMLDFRTMSEDKFTAAMHEYYQTWNGRRASTDDFRRIMEQHVGIPLDWFFRQYFEGTALPTYRTAWKAETGPDGKVVVHLRVEQSGVPDDWENYIPVSIDLGGGQVARLRIHVKGPTTTLDVPGMPATPKTVTFNDLDGVLAADFKSVGW